MLPPFERANGYTIRASYAPSGALIPRFDRGEPVDVFLTDSAAIDELIKRGKVMADRTDLARTGIGIAVRKGASKPDVSSAEALKRALLEARTVGHAAPSGGSITAAHIQGVFQRLGIAAEVTPKVKLAAGGPNGRVSASSRAVKPRFGSAAGFRADVESRGRGDRHAAGGVAADYDLFCRGDDERQRSRSGEGADHGTDRAVCGTHL